MKSTNSRHLCAHQTTACAIIYDAVFNSAVARESALRSYAWGVAGPQFRHTKRLARRNRRSFAWRLMQAAQCGLQEAYMSFTRTG
jgi:hypothetical protein